MHRFLIVLSAALAAACSSGPSKFEGSEEIWSLLTVLRGPDDGSGRTEARLAELGDAALPALKEAVADPAESRYRGRAARALGIMWTQHGNPAALEAYLFAIRAAPNDPHARSLLAQAYRYRDPDKRVFALLEAAIKHMRLVTPEMIAAAGAMTDMEALEAMMRVVGKVAEDPTAPERDLALRYIGRAARRGRRQAVEFLRACTQSSTPDLVARASAELSLLAGRLEPKSWSAWWFDHNAESRQEWIVRSFPPVGGKPFDPTERDHIAELVARLPRDVDVEPELWFLEQVLGRKFGYVSPRDVFDPDMNFGDLSESNGRAIATVREWWREHAPFLYFNSATGRYEISEEAQRIGVPADPKTGKPGR